MIDGAVFKEEAESNNVMAVPTVYLNGKSFASGRMTLEEILAKLGTGPDASELNADSVLQDRLRSLPNVTIITNAQTKEITGDDTVNGLTYINRETEKEQHVELSGVFVQIGLLPNTDWLGEDVERNKFGEIVVNEHGETNIPGVFAAGDCTTTTNKQIIISMGDGANASLNAFNYLIRNE